MSPPEFIPSTLPYGQMHPVCPGHSWRDWVLCKAGSEWGGPGTSPEQLQYCYSFSLGLGLPHAHYLSEEILLFSLGLSQF